MRLRGGGCAGSKPPPPATTGSVLPHSAQSVDIQDLDLLESPALTIQRAASLGLEERLALGLNVDTIAAQVDALPTTAVDDCNVAIPRLPDGTLKFPTNDTLNGYVNQFHIARECEFDGLSMCERLRNAGAAGVGPADVFVSWVLAMPLPTLVDALRQYLAQHPELPAATTRFWVCDFVIRQGKAARADVAKLAECVRAVGRTVLVLEPWDDPQPLRRAYCIKEVYHTQASGGRFDVVMSTHQQRAFEHTMMSKEFDSIATRVSRIDVRNATCRSEEDTEAILSELEHDVGFQLVKSALNNALEAQARTSIEMLPAETQGVNEMTHKIAKLLHALGKHAEAEMLFREALEARRAEFGDCEVITKMMVSEFAKLLHDQGKLQEAEALYLEALEFKRATFGNRHPDTLNAINTMATLMKDLARPDEAESLWREVLDASRKALGEGGTKPRTPGYLVGLVESQQGAARGLASLGRT